MSGKEVGGVTQEEVFDFLDALRLSGVTNMFGATPYVEEAFGLGRKQSRALLLEWMKTFSERHPED